MAFGGKKNILGIDIGSRTTKIAGMQFVGGKAILDVCALAETGTNDEAFVSNLKSFLSEQKVRGMMAAASFDDPSMIIRKMELPKMPDADFLEALRWNLRDVVEGDPAEYTVSHSLIKENNLDGENITYQIVAYAVQRAAVMGFKNKLEQVGLTPHIIEPESVTMAAALDRCEQLDDDHIAGVDIGHNHTLFYVVGKRIFVFSRPIKGIDLSVYEKEPQEFPQKLAIEVQKSIDTFQVNFEMQPITGLYVSGGGALIEGLAGYLETNLGMKTQVLNPLQNIAGSENFSGLRAEVFSKAISLALAKL